MQNVTGGGEPGLLAEYEGEWRPTCRSPDGKEMLVTMYDYDPNHPRSEADIFVLLLGQNEKDPFRPFIQRNYSHKHGVWSPDGRWVAYASDESGPWEVYVEPYPGPGSKTMISNQGGSQPAWSRNGKELFYRTGSWMMAATVETEPDFRVIGREKLFEDKYLYVTVMRNYDVAPDGRFLMIKEPQEGTLTAIHVVTNWFEELERLVPSSEIH